MSDVYENESAGTFPSLRFWSLAFQRFCVYFAVTILINMVSYLAANRAGPLAVLFDSNPRGISFGALGQMILGALIFTICDRIIFSENLFPRLKYFWRVLILVLAAELTMVFFAAGFSWFAAEGAGKWIAFIVYDVIIFTVTAAVLLLAERHERRKYARLLAEYKRRHG